VEVHKKYAIAAASIVFVIVALPIALLFPHAGVGLVISVSLGAFAMYYVGLIGGESLGNQLVVSPFWAMWTPNFVFGAIGLLGLYHVRTRATRRRPRWARRFAGTPKAPGAVSRSRSPLPS
jgi:lipopolysaccharide export system permease protein